MGSINDNTKFIRTKLIEEMRLLSPDARREKYDTEIKGIISSLLKDCYPENSTDKIVFYNESFASMISYYDAETLLLNLFLEKDCAHIVNNLCKTKAFDDVKPDNLSKLSCNFLVYLNGKYLENNEFTENDEKLFIQSFFMSIVPSLNNLDWRPRIGDNPLIKKYLVWFKENLNIENLEIVLLSFITFIKLWDCFNEFSSPFNNTKAILFYNEINLDIETKLSNSSADIYFHLLTEIQKISSYLFVELKYIPLIDISYNIDHSAGYLAQRKKNLFFLSQACKIGKISSSWSYTDLIKDVSDDSPVYLVKKYIDSIMGKIKNFSYPSNEEIEKIIAIPKNKNIDVLKSKLFEKLYIFEI